MQNFPGKIESSWKVPCLICQLSGHTGIRGIPKYFVLSSFLFVILPMYGRCHKNNLKNVTPGIILLFFRYPSRCVIIPSPPRFLPTIFIAHRVQQFYCSSIFRRVRLTHDLLALSASHFVRKKKTPRIYTSTHSGGFELMKLTRTRLGINLISHRGDRLITCALLLLTTAATAAVVPIPSSSPLAEYEKRNPVINALATGTPFWGHEYSIGRDFGGSKEVLSKQKNATKYIDDTTQTASSGWRRRGAAPKLGSERNY